MALPKHMEAHPDESHPYGFHSPTELGYAQELRVTWEKVKKLAG